MTYFLRWIGAALRWFWRYGLALTAFTVFFVAAVPRSTVLVSDKWQAIAYEASPYYFDYVGWEVNAIAAKMQQALFGQAAHMSDDTQVQFVRDYFADVAHAQGLAAEINAIYTDPTVSDPDAASASLQTERDALHRSLDQRRSTTEAILEGQVATILVEEGFGIVGQVLPPVSMKLSDVPNLLVVSPRDEIRLEASLNVTALAVDEIAALETRIEERYDVSALVVPLGGIALYPAMIFEYASIPYNVETFAHEWLHHYLYFHPLGWSYFSGSAGSGEARAINETTADLFGKQIARRVLERYYPDLVPPEPVLPPDTPTPEENPPPVPEPPAFDLAAEMNETRVTVDALLADGNTEEAEAYMQQRRQLFYENGYPIRRLNQAFFAFYGGYQAGGGYAGSSGGDPIGAAVRSIWRNSDSPRAFIAQLRTVTSTVDLLKLQKQLEKANKPAML